MADRVPLLAIDTATSVAFVATGEPDGTLRREAGWTAGYRHGEELLGHVVEVLRADGLEPGDLGAIIIGTGPGAFTGLRIGLATAKTLAHELGVPIIGSSTAAARASAAVDRGAARPQRAVLLPAGPSAIVVVELDAEPGDVTRPTSSGVPRLVSGGTALQLRPGAAAIAVDLEERAEPAAVALGNIARSALAASLIALGARRLIRGEHDDVARLVPEYVSLPRGVTATSGEVAWSLGRR